MIDVTFFEREIIIQGHAGYAEKGYDIVCSSISVLTQFVAEIFLKENVGTYDKSDGYLCITISKQNDLTEKLKKYLLEAIKSIKENYPQYIKVEVK